ncbi:MAG: hypothetical protein ACSLE5_13790 [Porticoccaceae bacterium]
MQTLTKSPRSADWRAAVVVGVIAGLVFLMVNMALTGQLLGNAQLPLQLAAALVLGPGVMPPAVGLGGSVLMTGLGVHLVLAVGFTCLIAFCLHRWGILVGIFGGALFGLALYAITYYFVADFIPGFAALRSWLMAVSHIVFGAVAGGLYEALERDHR